MPIIQSAKKRARVSSKAAIRNSKTKRTLKSALKNFQSSLNSKTAAQSHNRAQSALDIAAKKGVLHKNKVARKKRQLATAAKAAGVKTAPKTARSAKKQAQKPTAKNTPAKKPATKKTPAKKPASKK